MSKRASIKRARKEAENIAKEERKHNDKITKYRAAAFKGSEDGKIHVMYSLSHTMFKLYGWKEKRCKKLIDDVSDDTIRSEQEMAANVIVFVFYDKAEKAMPDYPPGYDIYNPTPEAIEKEAYRRERNIYFKRITMFILDTLCDLHTYNFGTRRLERVLESMAEEYRLMQEKPLKWFEKRAESEVQIIWE